METVETEAPTLETKVATLATQARQFAIATAENYSAAGALWTTLKDMRAKVDESFDGIISKAHAAHKEALAQKKKHDEPLEQGQKAIKQRMIAWDQEQERLRKLEQARIDAENKRKAEEDALELAAELEKAGEVHAAAEVLEAPLDVQQAVIPKSVPKVEGFSYRSNWVFDVVDANAVTREYLCLDLVKIGQVVRAMKGATNIPGIKPREEKV